MSGSSEKDQRTQVVEFALGRLSAEDERAFEQTLAREPALQTELQEVLESLSVVAESFVESTPPPGAGLKENVLSHAVRQQRNTASSRTIVREVFKGSEGWMESGLAGITMKPLYVNESEGSQTVLVRIAAGVHYPKHRHVGTEECLVLEGDLRMNDIVLHAGDFIVNHDGDIHHDTWSESGCLLLLTGSLNDEFGIA